MTATEQCADLRKESQRLLDNGFRVEHEETNTLDRHIATARQDMGEQRWQQLNLEWETGQ